MVRSTRKLDVMRTITVSLSRFVIIVRLSDVTVVDLATATVERPVLASDRSICWMFPDDMSDDVLERLNDAVRPYLER